MRTQLRDYGFKFDKIPIYCDSKSTIAISCNPVQHTKTKHIDIRYHFIKDHVEKGTIELYFVNTEFQLADLFTKALDEKRFNFLITKLGFPHRRTRAEISAQIFRVGNCSFSESENSPFPNRKTLFSESENESLTRGLALEKFLFSESLFRTQLFRIGKAFFPNRKSCFSAPCCFEPNPNRKSSVSKSDFASLSRNSCRFVSQIRH
ncbi:hypothetical protein OSB04_001002 [Centaurea solstitialis]|uniref:Uncharacterized protein n=1 Tax=Centaurea solstitialis TaxID=347529 RepID=A0AA38U2V0_9ASTR|nr:hypothetical protein OSB04_001002 [Centaurea solstitialis]